MVNIKVIHKKAVRRFTLSSNATWIELEAKLRTLFNIPALSPFTLSYTDEDNDVITLSTDLELKEIFSSAPTVKFDLKFSTSDDSSDSEDSGNEVWVLEGRNIQEAASTTTDISGLQGNVSQKNIVSSTNQELQEPQFIEIDSRDVIETNKRIQTDENLEKEDNKEKKQVNLLDDEFFDSLNSMTKKKEKKHLLDDESLNSMTKPINEFEANETIETIETVETIETIESTPLEQEDYAIDLQQFQMMIEQNQEAIKEDPQLITSIKDIMDQIRKLPFYIEPNVKSRKRNNNFPKRPITPPIPGYTKYSFNVLPTYDPRSLTPPPIPGAFPRAQPVPWASQPPKNGGRGRGSRRRRFSDRHHHNDLHHCDREQKEKSLDEEEASDHHDLHHHYNREQKEKTFDEEETLETEDKLVGETTDQIIYSERYKVLTSMGFKKDDVIAALEKNDDNFDEVIERLLS